MSDKLTVTLPKQERYQDLLQSVIRDCKKKNKNKNKQKKKDETGTPLAVGVLNIRLIVKSL